MMTYRNEIWRKLFHLSSTFIALAYLVIERNVMVVALGVLVALALLYELLRRSRGPMARMLDAFSGHIVRDAEASTLTGATYVTIGALLAVALFDKPIAIAVLLIMSISDALASLVGRRWGSVRFLAKSLQGSAAFFVTALILSLIALRGDVLACMIGAAVATVVEAAGLKLGRHQLDDNLSVPLATGITMTLLRSAAL